MYIDFTTAMANPSVYPDPGTLKPDRFVKREGQPCAPQIISFRAPASVTHCLGAAFAKVVMKATFATLLCEYTFTLDPEQVKE